MKYEELVANDQQIPSINSQLCQLDNTEGVEVSSLAKLAEMRESSTNFNTMAPQPSNRSLYKIN